MIETENEFDLSLIKIPQGDILKFFKLICTGIEKSTKRKMTNEDEDRTLDTLWKGMLECWLLGDEEDIFAVITTRIIEDPCFSTKEMVIYSFNALKVLSLAMWDDFFNQMIVYAKSVGCFSITAFTTVERIKRVATRLRFSTDIEFIHLKI